MLEIQGLLDGLRPAPRVDVTDWAEANRIITTGAETGPFRMRRTPYMRKITDCLSPYQPYEEVVFKKSSQIGGPLAIDTPIATVSGWTTMADIEIGDIIFDENGKRCNVTYISPVMYGEACYRITFSDKTSVVADADHKWLVKKSNSDKYKLLRTLDMVGKFKKNNANLFAIDNCKPLEAPDAELPVPPYAFGAWLGDGHCNSNRITTHVNDAEEMLSYIMAEGVNAYITRKSCKGNCTMIVLDPLIKDGFCKRGHNLAEVGVWYGSKCKECHRQRSNSKNRPIGPVTKPLSFFTKVIAMGVGSVKRIPPIYLRASESQRMNLLHGLMDTDGTVGKTGGHCDFFTISSDLADDFCELVTSLGMKPIKRKKACKDHTLSNGHSINSCGYVYAVSFKGYLEKPVVRLKRKVVKLTPSACGRLSETYRRRITNIERVESVPVRCISVDSPSHLYLCGKNMVPTHNTSAGNNWLGAIMDIYGGPVLMVMPNEILAKRNAKQNIEPMIEACPTLRKKIPSSRDRDSGNTLMEKNGPGFFLAISWAGSANSARSTSFRYVYLDELSAYPVDAGGEGDPYELFVARTKQYGTKRKIFSTSTPTVAGECGISILYEDTDKQRYFIPCPCCGHKQYLEFERLRYDKGLYTDVWYECLKGCRIEERSKPQFLAEENGAEWIATAPEKSSFRKIGFQLSALYSPFGWYSWEQMARDFDKAENAPNRVEALKAFWNGNLGETWEEGGDVPEWDRIMAGAREYADGTVPKSVAILTAGVDIQKDRIEVEVKGWAANKEQYSVDYKVIEGRPDTDEPGTGVWLLLKQYLETELPREDGYRMPITYSCVDSGNWTSKVYTFCNMFGNSRCTAVKGVDIQQTFVSVPRPMDIRKDGTKTGTAMLRTLGVSMIKEQIYSQLKLVVNPETGEIPMGFMHFPQGRSPFYYKGLCAEKFMQVKIGEKVKKLWKKIFDRNEPLDLAVYSYAAGYLQGITRWDDARFADEIRKFSPVPVDIQIESRARKERKKSSFL